MLDLVVLLSNETLFFLLKVDAELIVDEGDDHTIMERDQVRWLVLSNLSQALHEHKGSIGRKLVLSLLGNVPSLFCTISDFGVISTNCLQFNLNHAFH